MTFGAHAIRYQTESIARKSIIDTYNWNFIGDAIYDDLAPNLSSPDDITYTYESTGHTISWSVDDDHPAFYNISLDGILYSDGTWENGEISFSADELSVGTHSVTVVVTDEVGHQASDDVTITVVEESSSTTSSTSAPNTSSAPPSTETTSSNGSSSKADGSFLDIGFLSILLLMLPSLAIIVCRTRS